MKLLVCVDSGATLPKEILILGRLNFPKNAQVLLVHVVEPAAWQGQSVFSSPTCMASPLLDQQEQTHRELLYSTYLYLKNTYFENVWFRLLHGEVCTQILKTATEFQPDLVILGSNNKSKLESFFLGSVSRTIMEKVQCSVAILKDED